MALSISISSSSTIPSSTTSKTSRLPELAKTVKSFQQPKKRPQALHFLRVKAASDDSECNTEECAPDKEVGKVSMEWVAGEKTKVAGTYPPRTRGWSGYVEKDTAGQTNIYSVEPAVYVAESAISSGTAGTSSDGSENLAAIVGGIGLISVAAASSILLQVGKNPPQMQTMEYSGASLSYYINKFKPAEVVEVSASSTESLTNSSLESESSTLTVESALPESGIPQETVPDLQESMASSESGIPQETVPDLQESIASSSNPSSD